MSIVSTVYSTVQHPRIGRKNTVDVRATGFHAYVKASFPTDVTAVLKLGVWI